MKRIYHYFTLFSVLLLLFTSEAILAQTGTNSMELRPYLATEQFSWKESTPQKSDFLTESGTRLALGLVYTNSATLQKGILLGVDTKIYSGSVGYTGNSFSLTDSSQGLKPFNSNTRYLGNTIQLDTGYRFPFRFSKNMIAFDTTFSLGSDYWGRDIGGGTLDDGTSVQGYLETYHSLYAKAGLGLALQTRTHKHRINIGIKRPLSIRETIDLSSLNTILKLNPQPALSKYFSWQVYPIIPQSSSLTLSFYMEQTIFSSSDAQSFSFTLDGQTYQSALYQPDSESTVTGLSALWKF